MSHFKTKHLFRLFLLTIFIILAKASTPLWVPLPTRQENECEINDGSKIGLKILNIA